MMSMIQEKWLSSLRGMLSKWVRSKDWKLLGQFEQSLSEIVKGDSRSTPLEVKRSLANAGYGLIDVASELGGKGLSPLVQALMQFICGYHDMNFRDAAHIGHGRMIALHGSGDQRELWLPELAQGSLIGIAATEPTSGSRVQGAKTIAKFSGGKYHLHGEKVFVSRIKEANALIVFFKFEQDEALSAMLIKMPRKGVEAELWEPIGLSGWSWGKLIFDGCSFSEDDVLGARGQGLAIFKEHLSYYRPMVSMVALGCAAKVLDQVMNHINLRIGRQDISIPRDSSLELIGDHYAGINGGILSAACAIVQNVEGSPRSSIWSRMTKAWSVERAYNSVSDLSLLVGGTAFRKESEIAKALCDLRGLLFADGIHDSLRRSVGKALLASPSD